jgi:tRNA (cytidine/uridine-2'-O-)-methyltransferase
MQHLPTTILTPLCQPLRIGYRRGMRAALFQPDQPGNVGAILRIGACLGVPIDIIEPCGFAFSDRALRRAGMDYGEQAQLVRHPDWASFERQVQGRIVLLTTKADALLPLAHFRGDDILLFGAESGGVPDHVHDRAELRVRIPQTAGSRSLNIAVAAGIAIAEALRQTELWPE